MELIAKRVPMHIYSNCCNQINLVLVKADSELSIDNVHVILKKKTNKQKRNMNSLDGKIVQKLISV